METNTHSGTWSIANYHNVVYTADERQLTAKAAILQIVIPSELHFSSHQLGGTSLSQLVLPGWCVRGGGLNALFNFFSHSENREIKKHGFSSRSRIGLFTQNNGRCLQYKKKSNLFYSINRDKDSAIPSWHEKHRLFSDIKRIFSEMVQCWFRFFYCGIRLNTKYHILPISSIRAKPSSPCIISEGNMKWLHLSLKTDPSCCFLPALKKSYPVV